MARRLLILILVIGFSALSAAAQEPRERTISGNGKTLVVSLNFYDLLGQQSNYDRWVNATCRSDTRYNSINSYAMLHVRYRLNMFGGKVDTEGRYDKKWGNNDRRR